jgi:SHS2 domain-containing protein
VPWEYVEDGVTSDVTFRAWGRSLDELFGAAADATTSLMVDPVETVAPARALPVALEDTALDLLLARFLDELIYQKDAAGLLLRATDVHVEHGAGASRVRAVLRGEPLDPARHALAADPKGVTLHGLTVAPTPDGWRAEVTIDV